MVGNAVRAGGTSVRRDRGFAVRDAPPCVARFLVHETAVRVKLPHKGANKVRGIGLGAGRKVGAPLLRHGVVCGRLELFHPVNKTVDNVRHSAYGQLFQRKVLFDQRVDVGFAGNEAAQSCTKRFQNLFQVRGVGWAF